MTLPPTSVPLEPVNFNPQDYTHHRPLWVPPLIIAAGLISTGVLFLAMREICIALRRWRQPPLRPPTATAEAALPPQFPVELVPVGPPSASSEDEGVPSIAFTEGR